MILFLYNLAYMFKPRTGVSTFRASLTGPAYLNYKYLYLHTTGYVLVLVIQILSCKVFFYSEATEAPIQKSQD